MFIPSLKMNFYEQNVQLKFCSQLSYAIVALIRHFRWVCIYPAYLNAAKTRAEGRHIAKKDCVINPTYLEIRDVLSTAGLAPIVENKKFPRERSNEIEFRGRIRVQLKKEDGAPLKEEFKSRKLLRICIVVQLFFASQGRLQDCTSLPTSCYSSKLGTYLCHRSRFTDIKSQSQSCSKRTVL